MYQISVEPILFFAMLTIMMYSMIGKEFIYGLLAKENGLDHPGSDPCNTSSVSPEIKALEAKVSAEASEWTLYLNIAGFIPSLFATVVAGSWGDVVGRRPPLLLSTFGLLIMVIIYMAVMQYSLPLYFMLLGRLICGICGDFPAILGSCFAYLSDTSTHRTRTIRVAVGEVSIALGGIIGSLLSGVWVDAQGYVTPMWLLFAGLCFCILYIICYLPESVQAENDSYLWKIRKLFSKEPFIGLFRLLKADTRRTKYILVVLFCFFLEICNFDGIGNTLTTYLLSPPFCYTNTLVGYTAAFFTGGFIFGAIFLKLAQGHIKEIWMVLVSITSSVCAMLVLIFSRSVWLTFAGIVIGCLQNVAPVIFRSVMSRLVSASEQGSVFSLIACSESIAGIVSSFMFNGLYAVTVVTFPASIMTLVIGLDLIILLVFGLVHRKIFNHLSTKTDEQNENLINENEAVET